MARAEFDRIARLTARFGAPPPPDLGIGDDAAILHPRGALVATVDASVEGIHFRRSFAPLEVLTARAVEAAASDIAAMGARFGAPGTGFLFSWALPAWVDDGAFDAMVEGARRAAERLGASVLGGNLSSATELSLHTTALGALGGRGVTRAGASPGDRVYVSGACGGAAVGLEALLQGRSDDPAWAAFVHRWRVPSARVDLAWEVAGMCSAAIDLSDGLVQDAGHLARASGVGLEVDLDRLPMLAAQRLAAAALGLDADETALTGGEDYELLVTAPGALPSARWTEVGRVIEGDGVTVCEAGGRRSRRGLGGWDHFRGEGVTSPERSRPRP